MVKQKRGNKKGMALWIWILIILLILVVGGVVAYFLFSGNGGLGGGIPSPPALPN